MKKRIGRKAAFLICLLFTGSIAISDFFFVRGKAAVKTGKPVQMYIGKKCHPEDIYNEDRQKEKTKNHQHRK